MMDAIHFECQRRESGSKSDARALRRTGMIPGVVYGLDRPAVAVSVDPKSIIAMMRHATKFNTLVELVAGGDTQLALVQDVQRHPVTMRILHVDFLRVDADLDVVRDVPLLRIGERALGEQAGGLLQQMTRTLKIRCKPGDIPASIEFDPADMEIGMRVMVDEVDLKEGLSHVFKERFAAFSMVGGRADLEVPELASAEDAEEATETEGEAPVEGEGESQ